MDICGPSGGELVERRRAPSVISEPTGNEAGPILRSHMKKNELRMKIEAAKARLLRAEEAMAGGLAAGDAGQRGETTVLSAVLRKVFEEVKAARSDLADLEELVAPED